MKWSYVLSLGLGILSGIVAEVDAQQRSADVAAAEATSAQRFAFYDYVAEPGAMMMAYSPSQLDPRNPANQVQLPTRSIRADLEALRPAFDGLITYDYHEACTPRVLAVAKELKYRAVMIGIWQPKSAAEIDGVAKLVRLHQDDFALAVIVGNEGLTFKRYEESDLQFAAERLRKQLPAGVPLTTTEPLVGYRSEFVRDFGDFLAANIHPVFDAPNLDAADAVAWTSSQAERLAKEAGKPLVIKETGFPHAGEERYSLEKQRDFWAAHLRQPLLEHVGEKRDAWIYRGVAFESFDLPWKSEASGLPIERSWGLMSADREAYPAFEVWRAKAEAARTGK